MADSFESAMQNLQDLLDLGFLQEEEFAERKLALAMEHGRVVEGDGANLGSITAIDHESESVNFQDIDIGHESRVFSPQEEHTVVPPQTIYTNNSNLSSLREPVVFGRDLAAAEGRSVSGEFENNPSLYFGPRTSDSEWRDEADAVIFRRWPQYPTQIAQPIYVDTRASLKHVDIDVAMAKRPVIQDVDRIRRIQVRSYPSMSEASEASPAWRVGMAGAQTKGAFIGNGGSFDFSLSVVARGGLYKVFPFLLTNDMYWPYPGVVDSEDAERRSAARSNSGRKWARLELCLVLSKIFVDRFWAPDAANSNAANSYVKHLQRVLGNRSELAVSMGAAQKCFLCASDRKSTLFCELCEREVPLSRHALNLFDFARDQAAGSQPVLHCVTDVLSEAKFAGILDDDDSLAKQDRLKLTRDRESVGCTGPCVRFYIDRPTGYAPNSDRILYASAAEISLKKGSAKTRLPTI